MVTSHSLTLPKPTMYWFKRLFSISLKDITISVVAIIIALSAIHPITYATYSNDLSSEERIMNRNNTGVVLYDRNNQPFFTLFEGKEKTFVPISEIPKQLQQAVIAAEDKDFYKHDGFSFQALTAAVVADVKQKDFSYGGSTITQQLVKNSLLSSNKTILRKYQEIILAEEVERKYSKDKILEMYLNSVYFGEGAIGIEEAAQTYFNKNAKDLTLAESSLLVGLLPAPSTYSPLTGSQKAAKLRQEYVLQQMVDAQFINSETRTNALAQELTFNTQKSDLNNQAMHFALFVKDQLVKKYGEEAVARSGFKVKTSIDLSLQSKAEEVVKNQVEKLMRNNASNGAAIILNPKTGEILAMVGSKDWYDEKVGKVNIITANRPPGSSFKPIIYAKALEQKAITPSTMLDDKPTTFQITPFDEPYKPQNYDRKFRGKVIVRRALANSLNVPAVEIQQKIGLESGMEMAQRLGITTLKDPSQYGLSFVLGSADVKLIDMATVYATFANQGKKNLPTGIIEITDKTGEVVYNHKPEDQQVLSPDVAFIISSMLSDKSVRREAFGTALDISKTAAVKTGTTEDYKDALTFGYTPDVVVGVWVGNNDNTPMDNVAGSLGAAPIWKNLMEHSLAQIPDQKFAKPDSVLALSVCKNNGFLIKTAQASATSSATTEYFLPGTQPTKQCSLSTPPPSPSSTPSPDGSQPAPPPPSEPQAIQVPPPDPEPITKDDLEKLLKKDKD